MSVAQIKTRTVEGVAVIYPGPYLNQLRGEILERHCEELLRQGVLKIVVNFSETELINSIGISILLGVIEAVNENQGSLVLCGLSDSNRELFEMLGLMSHIEVGQTEEEALLKLNSELV